MNATLPEMLEKARAIDRRLNAGERANPKLIVTDTDRALALDIAFASADVVAEKVARHVEAKNFLIRALKAELWTVTQQLRLYAGPPDAGSNEIADDAVQLLRRA